MSKIKIFKDWICVGGNTYFKIDAITGLSANHLKIPHEKVTLVFEPELHIFASGVSEMVLYDDIDEAREDFEKLKELLGCVDISVPEILREMRGDKR